LRDDFFQREIRADRLFELFEIADEPEDDAKLFEGD